MVSFENTATAFASKTDEELRKTYLLFRAMGNEKLVSFGSKLMMFSIRLGLPVKGLIKRTIFRHFCGGESISDCERRILELGSYNIKTILDYSVEGKESPADFEACTNEIIDTIKRAKGDSNIPFSVFKVTGIARFNLLKKKNAGKPLTADEATQFARIEERIDRICRTAYELDVPVFIDAEESWIQDTIDALVLAMMERYNKQKAVVYNTAQMYRHDRMNYLEKLLHTAREKQFKIGIKLVRGAYMEKERERARSMGYASPIQPTKTASDKDFDRALAFCLEHIDIISVCCGSHNEKSNLLLTELMKQKQIAAGDKRIYFAQLLGMSDHISYNLSDAGYNVAKYVPYGPVKEVMPYLIRRAEENTSIAGQAGRELTLIRKEIQRRKKAN